MNSTENSTQATDTEKTKRTRMSPRVKALDEVCGLIDAVLKDLAEQGSDEGVADVMSDLRGRVQGLADDGSPKAEYAGRHYIAELSDGTFASFDSNSVPTRRAFGAGTKTNYAKVYGPFRTTSGIAYRLERPTMIAESPLVF